METTTTDLRPAGVDVGALFRAGRHQAVLDRTIDAAEGTFDPSHVPYVVGSLALLGRIDEALALASEVEAQGDAAIAVAARFFAIVALCHGGRYADAERWARKNARATRDPDPSTRFFAFQGLALLRYFTGAIGHARRPAKRALEEAVRARFSYGRLLALDLSGHVLVQRGEVSAGLRVLEQAERLAESLGAPGHRAAIECARLAYQNRHGRAGGDLEAALSRVAAQSGDNHYTLRAAWLELAFRTAIVGDAPRAREALERAREQALPERDHRARARLFLVEAIVRRLDGSLDDVRASLVEAARALDRGEDRVLRTELLVWDRVLGAGALTVGTDDARRLREATETSIAEVLVALSMGVPLAPAARSESPLLALLASDADAAARAEVAIERGWLGLVPLLSAPAPGRWLFLLRDAIVAADRGAVSERARLPGHAREILAALRRGPRAKEDLVREVWGVPRYAPQLHDPVVHTAIARLRRALGDAADWIETGPSGYALAAGVELIELGAPARSIEAEDETEPAHEPARTPPPPAGDDGARVLAALAGRPLRSTEIAERLRVSEATALRRLREMAARGAIVREGVGKRTRYRLP